MKKRIISIVISISTAASILLPLSPVYADTENSIEYDTGIETETDRDITTEISEENVEDEQIVTEIPDMTNEENPEEPQNDDHEDTGKQPSFKAAVSRPKVVTENGKRYAVRKDGTHHTGWLTLKNGSRVYCDPADNGAFATGYRKFGKKGFLFSGKGILYKGKGLIKKNGKIYFVKTSGVLAKGWQTTSEGKMYFSKINNAAKIGVKSIGDNTYLFNKNGAWQRKKGVRMYKGEKYWVRANGTLGKGWHTTGAGRMFFSRKFFRCLKGTAKIKGVTYHFDDNGILVGEGSQALVSLDPSWLYADYSAINSGQAVLFYADANRKNITVAVNAGHGTQGGSSVRTYCHPDKTAKVTGGSTAAGSYTATAVAYGMTFNDGTEEKTVTLRMAQLLRDDLLAAGYDVLMLRNGEDVQLDNIARTVIANNKAACHIALHWDSDGMGYDKGAYYMSVPDALKYMYPVSECWAAHEALGDALLAGLQSAGAPVWGERNMDMDLTQTSYSTVPSVVIELGNQCSVHDDYTLQIKANGLLQGINAYFGQ